MSVFYQPLGLSLIAGLTTFICCYRFSDQILNFFSKKTFKYQKEIIEIMDLLLIDQKKQSIIRNCWIFSLALSGIGFLIFWPNVLVGLPVAAAVFLFSWTLILKILQGIWQNHCLKVVADLQASLTVMSNSLKVGLGLTQSMERVIKSYPGALSKEFRLALNKVHLGQTIEEALVEMGERVNKPDVDMLITAINILKETGGNLAETFYVMSKTLQEKSKMDKKIRALTAQGVMQARIISAIPFLLILMFFFMDRPYIMPLLTKPLGWACLAVVVILVAVGAYAMRKMIQIEV